MLPLVVLSPMHVLRGHIPSTAVLGSRPPRVQLDAVRRDDGILLDAASRSIRNFGHAGLGYAFLDDHLQITLWRENPARPTMATGVGLRAGDPADIIRTTRLYGVRGTIPDFVTNVRAVLFASDTILWLMYEDVIAGQYAAGLFVDVSHQQPSSTPLVRNPNIETSPGAGYRMVPHDERMVWTNEYNRLQHYNNTDGAADPFDLRRVQRLADPEGAVYMNRRFWVRPTFDPEQRRWGVDLRVLYRVPEPCGPPLATIDGHEQLRSTPPYRADAPVSCHQRQAKAPLTSVEQHIFPDPRIITGNLRTFTGPNDPDLLAWQRLFTQPL